MGVHVSRVQSSWLENENAQTAAWVSSLDWWWWRHCRGEKISSFSDRWAAFLLIYPRADQNYPRAGCSIHGS